ncbi:MAG: F0F1-type ATP synthase assembly protein I [Cyclobacteriaceae bacterium]|jgi:F0F1-type ATP synthase assembly protein I
MKEEKMQHSSKPNPNNKEPQSRVTAISVTFELLSLNLIIIGGGYYLNDYLNLKIPWILIFSILLSVVATIYYLLKKFGE